MMSRIHWMFGRTCVDTTRSIYHKLSYGFQQEKYRVRAPMRYARQITLMAAHAVSRGSLV